MSHLDPEQEAREQIDAQLEESGWVIQNRDEINLGAGLGVAIREFKLKQDHGYADYLLFIDGQAVGVLEAKKVGFPLGGVEVQANQYSAGLPNELDASSSTANPPARNRGRKRSGSTTSGQTSTSP